MNHDVALIALTIGAISVCFVLICFGGEIESWFRKIIKGEDIKKPKN